METRIRIFARTAVALVLSLLLTGVPAAFAQQATPATNPDVAPTPIPQAQQPAATPVPGNTQVDPTQGPLEPVPVPLPDSPGAAQPPQQQQQPTTVQTTPASNAPAV